MIGRSRTHHHHHSSSSSSSSSSRKTTTNKRRLVDAISSPPLSSGLSPPPPHGPPPAKSARRERTRYTRNSNNNNKEGEESISISNSNEVVLERTKQQQQSNQLNDGFGHESIDDDDSDDDDDDTSFVLPKHEEDEEEEIETNDNDDDDEEEEGDWSLFYDSQYDSDSDSSSSSSEDDDEREDEDRYDIDNDNESDVKPAEETATTEEDGHDDGVLLDHLESIERLQRKLDRRKERLQELSARRKIFPGTSMIVAQEEAARPVRMNHFLDTIDKKEQRKQEYIDDNPSPADDREFPSTVLETIRMREIKIESERSKPSIFQQTAWFCLFELLYTAPGVFGIWLSTVTNSTFYGTLSGSLRLLYRSYLSNIMSKTQYSVLLVAVGLSMLRLNGAVFDWLEGDNYTISRVVMSNRTRLGTVDAKIRRWITSLSFVNSAFNLFGYYIVYAGMVHFNYNIFPGIFDSILYSWLYQTFNLAVLQLEEEELHSNMEDYYKYWSSPDTPESAIAWMEISSGGTSAATTKNPPRPPPSTCLIPCDWNVCGVEEVDAQLTSRLGMTPSCDMMMEQVSWPWSKWIIYMLCNDRDSDQDVGWTLYFISAFCVALTLSYFYGYSLLRSCD